MPEFDESLSWGKVVIPYVTPCAEHVLAFHCASMSATGVWDVPYSSETTVFDTAEMLLELMSAFIPTGTTFNPLIVYKNNLEPVPTEFWLTGEFDAPSPAPAATVDAANTITLNLRTSKNRRVKFVIADTNGGYPVPALVKPGGFPTVTNTLFAYLIANPNIVTIDGEDITVPYSVTVTMNDTLSRRYGMAYNTFETP